MRRKVTFILILTSFYLTGCDTLGYYAHGAKGHLQLMSQRRDINQVIEDEGTPDKTRQYLQTVKQAKQFAREQLKLPDNNSYNSFSDLKRDKVTWNVVATPELSMQPYQSCFPITGCLSYRGYFDKNMAETFAHQLEQQGYETYIGGSTAYSTLGWFNDPIVSPMLRFGELHLVETLFHELAHQQLYIKNDSNFNEAFATTIGQTGLRRWLEQSNPQVIRQYNAKNRRHAEFLGLLNQTSKALKTLYQSDISDEQKRLRKQQEINKLRQDYQQFKAKHNNYSGYDAWFKKPINNPRLAMVSVYHQYVPDFERWLDACQHDYDAFYAVIAEIGRLSKQQRYQMLSGKAQCSVKK